MSESFDPYLHWLGIRDPQRPPNHYALLGVVLFESDPDVLMNAADRQMAHVRTFQTGKHSAESQKLLNELAAAKICLLDPEKKAAYDAKLRAELELANLSPSSLAGGKMSARSTAATVKKPAPPTEPVSIKPVVETPHVEPSNPLDDLLPEVVSVPTLPYHQKNTLRTLKNTAILLTILAILAVIIFESVKAYHRWSEQQAELAAKAAAETKGVDVQSAPSAPTLPPAEADKQRPAHTVFTPPPDSKAEKTEARPPASAETPADITNPFDENTSSTPASRDLTEKEPLPEKPAVTEQEKAPAEIDLRFDIPDAKAQAAALREIRTIFSAQYKNLKEKEQKLALAHTLLRHAAESKDNPVARFVLYSEVRDLAVAVGDANMLREAIKTLATEYKIDEQALAADTLFKAAKKSRDPAGNQALTKMALELAEAALRKEDDEMANRLAEIGREIARKSRDPLLIKRTISLMKNVEERKRLRSAYSEAERILAENPDDPQVCQIAGQYYCLVKDDWDRGLKLLAKSNDKKLRALIEEEQLRPHVSPADMAVLGDFWRENEKNVLEANRYLVRARAIYWYRLGLPQATGITKAKIEMRLMELNELNE